MTRLREAFDVLVERGEPVGADTLLARAREAAAAGGVAELQPTPMRRRRSFWIAALVAASVAIVAATLAWSSHRQAAPAGHPNPMLPLVGGLAAQLAHQISDANLGCESFYADPKPADRTFPGSKDEAGCRVGANTVVIASFADIRTADRSIRKLLCSTSRLSSRTYLRGDHWIIYPSTPDAADPIHAVVGGTVEQERC